MFFKLSRHCYFIEINELIQWCQNCWDFDCLPFPSQLSIFIRLCSFCSFVHLVKCVCKEHYIIKTSYGNQNQDLTVPKIVWNDVDTITNVYIVHNTYSVYGWRFFLKTCSLTQSWFRCRGAFTFPIRSLSFYQGQASIIKAFRSWPLALPSQRLSPY